MTTPYNTHITLQTTGAGLYEFTNDVTRFVEECEIETGLMTLFCQHTSASLTIQENADPDVCHDLNLFFRQIVPENEPWYRHRSEGSDDMPAHIKSALTDVSLSIPVINNRLALGTWQGIYLFEHRHAPHLRSIICHLA